MDVTIAICTYNNAAQLRLTVKSLMDLRPVPGVAHEILVVDNNCSDDTAAVVRDLSPLSGGKLRSVAEPRQGLSYGRNRALYESKADIVCFIDDDVRVDPHWLAAVVSAFQDHQANVVGGRSYLIFENTPPNWVSPRIEISLSKCDYGNSRLINPAAGLFGLNFSVRRLAAIAVGGFNPTLGRIGKRLMNGEEIDLQNRIAASGGVVVYEPAAVVGHRISSARLRRSWFMRREYWEGISMGIADRTRGKPRMILGSLNQFVRCSGNYCRVAITGNQTPSLVFERLLNAVRAFGYFQSAVSSQIRKSAELNRNF